MIPGANILNMAMSIIAKQCFDYYRFQSRTPNENGIDVTTYFPARPLQGSVQAVSRELYAQYDLDLQKNYLNFYVSRDIMDVGRDVSGDQFFFNGKTYQCLSITPWFAMDGWDAVLTIEVTNAR